MGADHAESIRTGTVIDPSDQESLLGSETSLRYIGEGVTPNEASPFESIGHVGHSVGGRHRSVEMGEK